MVLAGNHPMLAVAAPIPPEELVAVLLDGLLTSVTAGGPAAPTDPDPA